MAVLKLPHLDTESVRDTVRDLSRDLDASRLVEFRDELGRIDLPSAGDVRRELGRIDLPSARDVRRELGRIDLPSAEDVRRELGRIDLPSASDLRRELDHLELPDVGRFIGRPARPARWVLPTMTPAVILGAAALMAGLALGGVLAWLYQPGAGAPRRTRVRRRLHRLQRSMQHRG